MKILSKTLLTIVVTLFSIMSVGAISVDSNNITIDKGDSDSIDVYADLDSTVTNVDFNLIYSTYDVVANFVVNPDFRDTHNGGIKHGIVLGEHEGGTVKLGTIKVSVVDNPTVSSGTVSITGATSKNANLESKILNTQVINVNVNNTTEVVEPTEEPEEKDYNLLKSIDSDIVNIKLKKDVFKYEVTISEEIEELDLKPIAISDSYKTTISSQKISELKDNKITINVSNDEIEKEYEIEVNVKENDDEKENVSDSKEKESTFKYKSKWVISIIALVAILVLGIYLNKKKK